MNIQTEVLLSSLLGTISGEEVLFRTEDDWGEIIVAGCRQFRILRFDEVFEQSKVNLLSPHVPVHQYIRAMLMASYWSNSSPALLLGLGGGALLRALHAMDSAIAADVVELRPAVIEVAREWFTLPDTDTIRYFEEDAVSFLARETGARYPLIFADLYLAWEMDPLQGTETFLVRCRALLQDDGWLVINYLTVPRSDTLLYQSLYRVFSAVFICQVTEGGNVIIYATGCRQNAETLRQRAVQNSAGDGYIRRLAQRLERL
ncbi:fused MFS/spermidine synthase [Enterobacter cloacae]|uniref:spermidine synthase n=1 Tax=Enterobacter cloacae TaxID=550 RepID=UPI0034A4E1C9